MDLRDEYDWSLENIGEIEDPSAVGIASHSTCGDAIRAYLKIDKNRVVEETRFKVLGCVTVLEGSSTASRLVKGKTVDMAKAEIVELLDGENGEKIEGNVCSLLAIRAVHAALEEYTAGAIRE